MWQKLTETDREEIVKNRAIRKRKSLRGSAILKTSFGLTVIGIVLSIFTLIFIATRPKYQLYDPGYGIYSFEDMLTRFPYILGAFLFIFFIIYFIYIVRIFYLDKTGYLEEAILKRMNKNQEKICLKCDVTYKKKKNICPACTTPLELLRNYKWEE